jgi:hypothetical protein
VSFLEQSNDRRLPADYDGDVLLWDIDKTYLDTRFSTIRGLLSIPLELAIDKRSIPGAAVLLRALRRGSGVESALVPLYFISGSPPQLRKVVEKKMVLEGVDYDGITFKDQLGLLLAGKPGLIKAQLHYKLKALLLYKRELPENARWLLFGDDVEEDAEAFLMFGKVCAGLRDRPLEDALIARGVGIELAKEIAQVAAPLPKQVDPVDRVFIHLDRGRDPASFGDPRVVPTRSYLQSALVLAAMNKIRPEAVGAVAKDLRRRMISEDTLAEHAADAGKRLAVPDAILELARQ